MGFANSSGFGGMDAWLFKTDAARTMEWNQTYGGAEDDEGWSLIGTADGGYAIIAGNTYSFGVGDQDFYVVKTNEIIPESLTLGVVMLLSTVSAIIAVRLFRKRSNWKKQY